MTGATWATAARAALVVVIGAPTLAMADPTLLSKQYPRCTTCHYADSGGGLLTPYGRSLSREEISMFGRQGASADPAQPPPAGWDGTLFGFLGEESPLQLGLDLRPSHLDVDIPGRTVADRNFLMTLDLQAAWHGERWTAYGTIGRQPRASGGRLVSYEHWVAYRVADGVSVRGGRFLPAYGVRFADHTMLTRERLALAQDDQIYGVEVGISTDRTLLQVSVGPGHADTLLHGDGRRALTGSSRLQIDVSPRTVVVASGRYHGATSADPARSGGGVAVGYAPAAWLTTWTQADVQHQVLGPSRRSYIVAHQTSVEVLRGLWVRVSPQVRWTDTDPSGDLRRMVYGVDVYPRPPWHVTVSYARDRVPATGRRVQRLLAQLHLYL